MDLGLCNFLTNGKKRQAEGKFSARPGRQIEILKPIAREQVSPNRSTTVRKKGKKLQHTRQQWGTLRRPQEEAGRKKNEELGSKRTAGPPHFRRGRRLLFHERRVSRSQDGEIRN